MMTLLIIIPWFLTAAALFVIMFGVKKKEVPQEGRIPFMDDDLFNLEEDEHETLRVALYDEKAYWVYKNVFYESEISREPDWATARPIDTMSMNEKQLTYLLKVLDDLKEDEEAE